MLCLVANDTVKLWYYCSNNWFDVSGLGIEAYQRNLSEVEMIGTFFSADGQRLRLVAHLPDEEFPSPEDFEKLKYPVDSFCVDYDDQGIIEAYMEIGSWAPKNEGLTSKSNFQKLDKQKIDQINTKYIALQAALEAVLTSPDPSFNPNSLSKLILANEVAWGKKGLLQPSISSLNDLLGNIKKNKITPLISNAAVLIEPKIQIKE